MSNMKDTRADAKLKNLPEEDLEFLWTMRNPSEDGEKVKFEDIRVYIKNELGIQVSGSTLSEFYSWLTLKKRMERAEQRAEQAKLEMLKDGNFDADDIERVAQAVFTNESFEAGNVKSYVALAKLRLARRALDHDERRIKLLEENAASAKAKLENLVTTNRGGLTAETLKIIEEAAGLL